MSEPSDSTLVMMGLVGSGKTNYLIALDVVLDDQTDVDGLVHSGLADDRSYLQPLKEKWLLGEELKHTSRQQQPPPHQLRVHHPRSDTNISFFLPDLAGETFDAQFETRSFPLDFCQRLQEARGLLLFLHCNHGADNEILKEPGFIELVPPTPEAPAIPGASGAPGPTPATVGVVTPVDWSAKCASRQVKLVELLQFIAEIEPRERPLKIALMLSAWDLVETRPRLGPKTIAEVPPDPSSFFSKFWPLLDQFLLGHAATFQFRAFGVSARGGGTSKEEIARLTAVQPSNRVFIVDGKHRSNDLTRPVRWLLGLLND